MLTLSINTGMLSDKKHICRNKKINIPGNKHIPFLQANNTILQINSSDVPDQIPFQSQNSAFSSGNVNKNNKNWKKIVI